MPSEIKNEISRRRLTLAAMTSGEETPSSSPRRGPLSSILSFVPPGFDTIPRFSQQYAISGRQHANREMRKVVPDRFNSPYSLDREGFVAVLLQKPSKKRSLVASGRLFGFKHTLNRLIRLVFWSRDFVFVLHSQCYHLDFMNWRQVSHSKKTHFFPSRN